jgi:hypothetical protein
MSGQLRHAGNDLPEFLPSDHRRDGSESSGASGQRRLQSQLHNPAACLQTALLKRSSRGGYPRAGACARLGNAPICDRSSASVFTSMWTLAFGHHEDRTPTHGYAATREDAMAAFAKSWRRE